MAVRSCTERLDPVSVERYERKGLTEEQIEKVDRSVERLCESWGISCVDFDRVTATIFDITDEIVIIEQKIAQIEVERRVIREKILIEVCGEEDLKKRSASTELKFMDAQKEVDDLTAELEGLIRAADECELKKNMASEAHHAAKTARDNRPSAKVKTRLNAELPGLMQAKSRTSAEFDLARKNVLKGEAALARANSRLADLKKEKGRALEAMSPLILKELNRSLSAVDKRIHKVKEERNMLWELIDASITQFIDDRIVADTDRLRPSVTDILLNISRCRLNHMTGHTRSTSMAP